MVLLLREGRGEEREGREQGGGRVGKGKGEGEGREGAEGEGGGREGILLPQ